MRKRRMIPDDDLFHALWRSDISPHYIARIYGVTRPAVYRAAARFDLGPRGPVIHEPEPEPVEIGPMTLEAELAYTGGKYSLVLEIAQREGWTMTQAMAAYHKARCNG